MPCLKVATLGLITSLILSSPAAAQSAEAASQFVPAVAASDTTAVCEETPGSILRPGERGFLLRYPTVNGIGRAVSAVWDSSGRLERYGDARGDLRGPPTPIAERGPRTTIQIDKGLGFALLLNEEYGHSRGSVATTIGAALAAEQLGPPTKLLARLHTQCGAPAMTP